MFKKLATALLLTFALLAPASAQINVPFRVLMCESVRTALATGATFQVWNATIAPASADVTITGTLLAEGPVLGANLTCAPSTALMTLSGLTDSAINTTGTPNWLRIIDDGGARVQLTARMSAATGTAQVVITDTVDSAALQLLQNRALTTNLTLQF